MPYTFETHVCMLVIMRYTCKFTFRFDLGMLQICHFDCRRRESNELSGRLGLLVVSILFVVSKIPAQYKYLARSQDNLSRLLRPCICYFATSQLYIFFSFCFCLGFLLSISISSLTLLIVSYIFRARKPNSLSYGYRSSVFAMEPKQKHFGESKALFILDPHILCTKQK